MRGGGKAPGITNKVNLFISFVIFVITVVVFISVVIVFSIVIVFTSFVVFLNVVSIIIVVFTFTTLDLAHSPVISTFFQPKGSSKHG